MKVRISRLLTGFGFAIVAVTIAVILLGIYGSPLMLKKPDKALSQVRVLLDAASNGDYDSAGKILYGAPKLGRAPEEKEAAADLLWQAYRQTLSYEIIGDCYASGSGLAVDVRMQCLDLEAALASVHAQSQTMLEQKITQVEDMSQLYDAQGNFRPELISQVLEEAVALSLQENRSYREKHMTLHLVYEQGQWWVMPETPLLEILSGSVGT